MFSRRHLLKLSAGGLAAGLMPRSSPADDEGSKLERVTLTQVVSTHDVGRNLATSRRAFDKAIEENAGWILFPEMFLSGPKRRPPFPQQEVSDAFDEIRQLCRKASIVGLIGTGWREGGKTYNQVRVVAPDGKLASVYAKTLLTRNDAKFLEPGPLDFIHVQRNLRFGVVICNDLWVTPGFSEVPDTHLTLQLARKDVRVIFHAIGSGSDQRYRQYHESNLLLRAAEAGCPIVAVNSFNSPEINATSGVIGPNFAYLESLPRDREVVQTVSFAPRKARAAAR